jgi:hypothetical protein
MCSSAALTVAILIAGKRKAQNPSMDRRVCLKSVMIAGVAVRVAESPAAAPNSVLHGNVQLHMDLDVDPAHDESWAMGVRHRGK